jgi:hypothetical protein
MALVSDGIHGVLGVLLPGDLAPGLDVLGGEAGEDHRELKAVFALRFQALDPLPSKRDHFRNAIGFLVGALDVPEVDMPVEFNARHNGQELLVH